MLNGSTPSNQTSSASTLGSNVGSFLGSVANGTATSTDLQNIENELQQFQQSGSSSTIDSQIQQSGSNNVQGHHHHHHHHDQGGTEGTQDATSADSIVSDLSTFMNAVANGTATSSDLTNVEAEMESLAPTKSTQQALNATSGQGVSAVAASLLRIAIAAPNRYSNLTAVVFRCITSIITTGKIMRRILKTQLVLILAVLVMLRTLMHCRKHF